MKDTLKRINKLGGSDQLALFIKTNFPQMIKEELSLEQKDKDGKVLNKHAIFDTYMPGILTYPRRIIFVGPKRELTKEVNEFTSQKPVYDCIIVDDRAYIEYLEETDMHLKDVIPLKNWQIAIYRNKNKV